MKDGYIHVCFVLDESGSMYGKEQDVVGGFKKIIDEQKAIENGTCTISLFRFEDTVKDEFIGKDVHDIDVDSIKYKPGGCTAMNDGIGKAIDKIGKWLDAMQEDEKPEKNLIVIMTDGMENASREYTIEQVRDMIKEQTEKYNWTFMYLGTDITDASYANSIGVTTRGFSAGKDYSLNYDVVNIATTCYRNVSGSTATKSAVFSACLDEQLADMTEKYENETGRKVDNNA